MKVYTTDKIRNVVLLGHGSAGKTTLAEAMCFTAGITSRMGRVEDGNTISDFSKEEQKRGISINTSLLPIEWKDYKINVLDTPGFFDFIGEVEQAISVADAAVIVVSGKDGVQVGAEKAWELCDKYNTPRMFFITDMDIEGASYHDVVEDLQNKYGPKIVPVNLPIRENGEFTGYVSVLQEKAFSYKGKETAEIAVPDSEQSYLEETRGTLSEAVAETSEELMEKYFGGEPFTDEEIREAVGSGILKGDIVPVSCGSGTQGKGISTLLDDIVHYLPSAASRPMSGTNIKTNEVFEVVYNSRTNEEAKVGKLYVLTGNKSQEVPELHAGDLGALAKFGDAMTGDTLSTKAVPVQYESMEISKPYTYISYRAKNKDDIDKVQQALTKIMSEDPTFRFVNDAENRQTLLYGIGDLQLDVVKSKLKNEYKVEIETEQPKVAFRETIRKTSDVEYKYKKQTGGHGQYGHVKIKFSPSGNMDEPYEFGEEVVGGSVPRNFFPAVEKGIAESVSQGDAGPVLMEPIVKLKVTVPNSYTGDVMGDLNKRRGRVLGMNPLPGGKQVVEADVPMMELFDYCTVLRSMTGGRGDYEYEFARYEQAPADIQAKEVAARAEAAAAGFAEA